MKSRKEDVGSKDEKDCYQGQDNYAPWGFWFEYKKADMYTLDGNFFDPRPLGRVGFMIRGQWSHSEMFSRTFPFVSIPKNPTIAAASSKAPPFIANTPALPIDGKVRP